MLLLMDSLDQDPLILIHHGSLLPCVHLMTQSEGTFGPNKSKALKRLQRNASGLV